MDHHGKFPPSPFHWVSLKSYFDFADIGHYMISFWCLILYIIDTEFLQAYCLLIDMHYHLHKEQIIIYSSVCNKAFFLS